MSQRVVGYEGEGRHRRPIYDNEGPASVASVGQFASIGRLSALSIPETAGVIEGGAGPVERRQANEAERAAWRAEEAIERFEDAEPTPGPEEEPAMPPDTEATGFGAALIRHSEVLDEAITAYGALAAAEARWSSARAALRESFRVVEPGVDVAAAAAPPLAVVPDQTPRPEPKRRGAGGPKQRDDEVQRRGEAVLAALERHGGNTKAAGAELGMRGNVVARIAAAARARASKAS